MPVTLPAPVTEPSWQRHNLRVPREDRRLFARPSLEEAITLALRNRDQFALAAPAISLQGRSLETLRHWSRETVLQAAKAYTEALGETAGDFDPAAPLLMTGHQPAFFHPGVWVKNFGIDQMAQRVEGTALNLIVDNDTFSSRHVRIPAGSPDQPRSETLPFDRESAVMPWEEATVQDADTFRQFGSRVQQAMSAWNISSLLNEVWPELHSTEESPQSLPRLLTTARVRLERQWGLSNLELPISQLCTLDPFLWFTSHLLAHLPRFHQVHNEVLWEYREVNRIRSHTHPVPELHQNDDWWEAPFWIWKAGESTRHHLFARQLDQELWLSHGPDGEVVAKLPLTPEKDACCAVEVLRELEGQGLRLRTRALTTTLFARLCLADVFVHGIGGAKYDEMTDRILSRFYQITPPEFLTLSATLHLPLGEAHNVTPEDERRVQHQLRDLTHNPDRHLNMGDDPEVDRLIQRKQKLITEHRERPRDLTGDTLREQQRTNHRRHRELEQISERLATYTAGQRKQLQQELETIKTQLANNRILQDREFAWCLYPEEKLRTFFETLIDPVE